MKRGRFAQNLCPGRRWTVDGTRLTVDGRPRGLTASSFSPPRLFAQARFPERPLNADV